MKITAVTPSDAASDPKHPDHDRWVKETTLKIEVEHAKRLGLSFRDAETENAYWLQRAEAKAREKPGAVPVSKTQRKRKTRDERLAERPVSRRVVESMSFQDRAARLAETQRNPTPVVRRNAGHDQRLIDRPVTVRAAQPEKPRRLKDLSPCGRCGVCTACRREKRIYAMTIAARKNGDLAFKETLNSLWIESMHANNCTGPFTGWRKRDALRAFERRLDDVCDATIPSMGQWR